MFANKLKHPRTRYSQLMWVLFCLLVVGWLTPPLEAQDEYVSWHATGWAYRVIVETPAANADAKEVDVAQVKLIHAGALQADADDVRIFDLEGNAVAYQVTYQDAARYALISFQVPSTQSIRVIYFGNKDAETDPMRTLASEDPAAGPPQPGPTAKGWIPRAGLVLATYARPGNVPSPQNVSEMKTILEQSRKAPIGAGYRDNISDSFNPFGVSDHYVSIYQGWLKLPETGEWGFCTASSNASFSFLDGKELIHWPGDHQGHAGRRGEFNIAQTVEQGLHYVTYLHEHHRHRPLAFMGIRPPGQKFFKGFDVAHFPQPRAGVITRYETSNFKTVAVPVVELLDAAMFKGSPDVSLTRVRLSAQVPAGEKDKWQVAWKLGDGQSVTGQDVQHVYLEPGLYRVSMQAAGPQGQKSTIDWPLQIPELGPTQIDGLTTTRTREYGQLLDNINPKNLTGDRVAILALALEQIEHPGNAATAAKAALFKDDLSSHYLDVMLALGYMDEPAPLNEACPLAAHFERRVQAAKSVLDRMRLMASLVKIKGVWQRDLQGALKVYDSATVLMKANEGNVTLKPSMREATIAMGDSSLYAGQLSQAREYYQHAQSLARHQLSASILAARSGIYPQQVDQQLDNNKPQMAWVVIGRWKDEVPTDMLTGLPSFYEGKVFATRRQYQAAIAPLTLAIQLFRGSEYEAQAYWLLTQAYHKTGQTDAAKAVLIKLKATGLTGQWIDKADQLLKEQP